MLTDDPTNTDLHRIVFRANTHKRARLDNSRFSSAITVDLPFREMTDIEHDKDKGIYSRNWLGLEWYVNHNNKINPSLAQIETGLINEAMVQLRLSMTNVKQ